MTHLALNANLDKAPPSKLLKKARALQNRGQFRESRKLCKKLTDQGYESADLYHFYGLALRGCGEAEAAVLKISAALELRPEDATLYNSLGAVFFQMKKTEAAIEMFKRATGIDQKFYDAWNNLGTALNAAERYQAALVAFTCAYHINKNLVGPLLSIVNIYIDVRKYDLAKTAMDQLLANSKVVASDLILKRMLIAVRLEELDFLEEHCPKIDRSVLNLEQEAQLDHFWAYFLESVGRYDEAIEVLQDCVSKDTSHRKSFMTHLGLCYAETGRLDESISLHESLLKEYPEFIEGRYNLSFLQFKNGDLANGYRNYEARWEWREFPTKRRQFDITKWQGEPLSDKKLLVWREQGIGDEVRYASQLQDLIAIGADVTFECSPKLQLLWENSFPSVTVREEGPLNCLNDPAYADFDYQSPIGSLVSFLRPDIETFSKLQNPWIARDSACETKVRERLAIGNDELLVGLCWRSSNQAASRDKYFLKSEQFAQFSNLGNIRWLNVQYDAEIDELETFRSHHIAIHHFTDIDQKNDIVSACTLLGACDLIISVGGSVADLAGGLGVPMIYMTAENSEVFLGTNQVPWFQHCKSYPIKPFKGQDTIDRIAQDWPEIMNWAHTFKRDSTSVSSEQSVPLDLTYDATS